MAIVDGVCLRLTKQLDVPPLNGICSNLPGLPTNLHLMTFKIITPNNLDEYPATI